MTISARRFATVRRICDSLLIVLIGVVLFGVVLGRIVPLTGRTTLIIGGGSMEPALPMGAAVVVEPVHPADLRVGDVVSLRSGARLQSIFTHRVTRIVPRDGTIWVETKGDANAEADPSITSTEHIIGRVSATMPYAGFLLALLSVPSGLLFVVLLAGVLLTLTWLLESLEVDLVAQTPGKTGPGSPGPLPVATAGTPLARPATPSRGARAARLRHARRSAMRPLGPGD
jgi:signal peptidase I